MDASYQFVEAYTTFVVLHAYDPAGKAFTDGGDRKASQCMLIQRLTCVDSGRQVIVANSHLKAKMGAAEDVKRQIQVASAAASDFREGSGLCH